MALNVTDSYNNYYGTLQVSMRMYSVAVDLAVYLQSAIFGAGVPSFETTHYIGLIYAAI